MSTTAAELLEALRIVREATSPQAGFTARANAGGVTVTAKLRHMVELDVRPPGAPSGLGALIPLEELEAAAPALAEGFAAALSARPMTPAELDEVGR